MVYLVAFSGGEWDPAVDMFMEIALRSPESRLLLPGVWLINTAETIDELDARLRRNMRPRDRLFITEIAGLYAGFLAVDIWGWLASRV
ncbi:MAG: hypothetical protein HY678_01000 [Chloroflexi bacterium]|nr:hypothetical protein [Chloroflexota bacterium]